MVKKRILWLKAVNIPLNACILAGLMAKYVELDSGIPHYLAMVGFHNMFYLKGFSD